MQPRSHKRPLLPLEVSSSRYYYFSRFKHTSSPSRDVRENVRGGKNTRWTIDPQVPTPKSSCRPRLLAGKSQVKSEHLPLTSHFRSPPSLPCTLLYWSHRVVLTWRALPLLRSAGIFAFLIPLLTSHLAHRLFWSSWEFWTLDQVSS